MGNACAKKSNQKNAQPVREPARLRHAGALRFSCVMGRCPNSLRSDKGSSSPLTRCDARLASRHQEIKNRGAKRKTEATTKSETQSQDTKSRSEERGAKNKPQTANPG